MKKCLHPENYRPVVFKDMSNDDIFITRSTVAAKETIEIDGVTYPLVKLEITNTSHPFFTGKQKLVDTAGRVDKFMIYIIDFKQKGVILSLLFVYIRLFIISSIYNTPVYDIPKSVDVFCSSVLVI